jgi:hypothetical protein
MSLSYRYLISSAFTYRPVSLLACKLIAALFFIMFIFSAKKSYHQHKQVLDLGYSITAHPDFLGLF